MVPNSRTIDEIIKKAMLSGDFDHLPGTGKPIVWKDNPFTPCEMRMVENLLKNNNLAYPWMETRKEIEKFMIDLINKIKNRLPLSPTMETEISKQILSLNKKIFDYNLSVPGVRFQRRMINLEEILQSIKQEKIIE